ncbi:MAG: D-tyrosyl-tRNA(Tyr) deacylase [Bacilli bacterium]|nr:D-tyrosyl-tRNA(Tyr) deacylase [Bacilli bacterium]
MRVLIQRCLNSSVSVDNDIIGKIDSGVVLFVCFTEGDSSSEIDYMIDKIINLRIFDDENGIMNKSLIDVDGSILSISQFTLYADTRKGRRPSYINALNGNEASLLYDEFNNKIMDLNIHVETGKFGADMKVSLVNDGPVTIMLEKENNYEKKCS